MNYNYLSNKLDIESSKYEHSSLMKSGSEILYITIINIISFYKYILPRAT